MLSIDKTHIQKLKYEDLEDLLGLLCEAELRRYNVPSASVRWGGKQTSKDGGIDVEVKASSLPYQDGYIRRAFTGIQAKVSSLNKADIKKAMTTKDGALLDSIRELAINGGAYVLASANSDTAKLALDDRLSEMESIMNDGRCVIDFLDGNAIASWVRDFPGMIPWVRNKIGEPLIGWKPYGNWAGVPHGANADYIVDKNLRLVKVGVNNDPVVGHEAISNLRSLLRKHKKSVRLVGLSGVGKTRFVHALFEKEVGKDFLDPATVFYTDSSDQPVPRPLDLLNWLIAEGASGVLIIDNCSDALHSKLTTLLKASNAALSLLTVEYDIRKDLPAETNAFLLEPGSKEGVANVIIRRHPFISQIGALHVSNLAGGNYRLALLLSEHILNEEDVTQIEDQHLFERIFYQKKDKNGTLLDVGRLLSIVYSFDFSSSRERSEIDVLSQLSGYSARELFPLVKELEDRHIIQKRGRWRAVLPHALANKLARKGLERIPVAEIKGVFEQPGRQRLLKSLSRRLAYLTNSEEAKEISKSWIQPGGILYDLSLYDRDKVDMLRNIALLHSTDILELISTWLNLQGRDEFGDYKQREGIRKIVGYLAYYETYFSKCMSLLLKILILESRSHELKNTSEYIVTFFQPVLSGTKADVKGRLRFVRSFLNSDQESDRKLGEECLNAMLTTGHFVANPSYDFERTHIDGGLRLDSIEKVVDWYVPVLEFVVELYDQGEWTQQLASKQLHIHIRGLWGFVWLHDVIEQTVNGFLRHGTWLSGWVAVTEMLKFDRKDMGEKYIDRTLALQTLLAPSGVKDEIAIYVLEVGGQVYRLLNDDPNGDIKANDNRLRSHMFDLGASISGNVIWLKEHMLQLHQRGGWNVENFGKGVGSNRKWFSEVWEIIKDTFRERDTITSIAFTAGFLTGVQEINSDAVESYLEEALKDKAMRKFYPKLQVSSGFKKLGVERMKRSLTDYDIHATEYRDLWREAEELSEEDYLFTLQRLQEKEEGIEACLHILSWYIRREKDNFKPSKELVHTIQAIALEFDFNFTYKHRELDRQRCNELEAAIKECFKGKSAAKSARLFLLKILKELPNHWMVPDNLKDVLKIVAELQPVVFLDVCLGPTVEVADWIKEQYYHRVYIFRRVSEIDSAILEKWVRERPDQRALILAGFLNAWPLPFQKRDNNRVDTNKWSDLFRVLYEISSDKEELLTILEGFYETSSWRGSMAKFLKQLLPIYEALIKNSDTYLSQWANKQLNVLDDRIEECEAAEKNRRPSQEVEEPGFE
jgi:hypothetical protein